MTTPKNKNLLKSVALAAVFSAITATSVFAQAAISEPAAYQSIYPYRDVLNNGAPTRAAAYLSQPPSVLQAIQRRESGLDAVEVPHHHHRARHASR